MKKFTLQLFVVVISIFIIRCGSSTLPSTSAGDIPDWYMNPPDDLDYVFAPATATSRDLQLAVDKATTDGRAEVARQIETKIEGLRKKFDEEVGVGENATLLQQFTSATKTVVSQTLSGSKVSKKEIVRDGNNYRAYVLVEYPIGSANSVFLQQIKKQEELYTRFRSSQTFKELDEEVKKFEEKKSQENQ